MKNLLLLTFLLVAFNFSTQGQDNRKESREKIKALKVAYLTEKVALTKEEAQKFWPIYNTFDKKEHELKREIRSKMRQAYDHKKEFGEVSETESKELIQSKLRIDKELQLLEEKFIKDLSGIITYQKILKLQVAEMDFGRKLMRKYRNKKDD